MTDKGVISPHFKKGYNPGIYLYLITVPPVLISEVFPENAKLDSAQHPNWGHESAFGVDGGPAGLCLLKCGGRSAVLLRRCWATDPWCQNWRRNDRLRHFRRCWWPWGWAFWDNGRSTRSGLRSGWVGAQNQRFTCRLRGLWGFLRGQLRQRFTLKSGSEPWEHFFSKRLIVSWKRKN